MGKTIAEQEYAHVVRHAVGDTTKAYFMYGHIYIYIYRSVRLLKKDFFP